MTFEEFQRLCEENFDTSRPADISKEFNVTPQVVNNWKTRDVVPYRYVKALRKKISEGNGSRVINSSLPLGYFNFDVASSRNDQQFDINLINFSLNFLKIFKENYVLVVVFTLFFSLFSLVRVFFFVDNIFTSYATLLPSVGKSSQSQISGLASRFGINIGTGSREVDEIESAELYPILIHSNTMAKKILDRKFYSERYNKRMSLIKIFNNDTSSSVKRPIDFKEAHVKLMGSTSVHFSKKSPSVKLITKSSEAILSADIAGAIIEELQEMQKKFKGQKAIQKKNFIQERLRAVKKELTLVEEELKTFREKNRKISSSPALLLQEDRLKREVGSKMEVYTTLKTQYEIAQIEGVGSSNSIAIIDPPNIPTFRSSPSRRSHLIVGFIIGFSMSIFIILVKDFKKIFNIQPK